MPGYRRVLDHLRIPAGGRRCHAGEAVVALPAYAIVRLGIAEPVGFSLVREPHPVAAVLFADDGACQGVLLVRGKVDGDGAVPDRKRGVEGKSVYVSVKLGGCRTSTT